MPSVKKIEEALYRVEDCIPLPEAERLLEYKVTKPSLIAWCRTYKIGFKRGGRWFVHPDKLALLLEGKIGGK